MAGVRTRPSEGSGDAKTMNEIEYERFIAKIVNPASKSVLHDDAVNAAKLIDMWRGVALTLYHAIQEGAGGEGMDAYWWGEREESRIINSQSYQGVKP
jgi:hypothetical protein